MKLYVFVSTYVHIMYHIILIGNNPLYHKININHYDTKIEIKNIIFTLNEGNIYLSICSSLSNY